MHLGSFALGLVPTWVAIFTRVVLVVCVVAIVVIGVVCTTVPDAATCGFQVVAATVGAVGVVGRAGDIADWAVERVGRVKAVHGLVLVVVEVVVDEDVSAVDLDVLAAAFGAGVKHLVGAGKSAVGAGAVGVFVVGKVRVSHRS